jgi:hypothetical protein
MIRLLIAPIVSVLLLCAAGPAAAAGFEVWLIDQSNSPGVSYGGAIYIYRGEDLMGEDAARASAAKIDLGGATAQLCMASTGATPVRPHMIFFNSTGSHAVLAFVASGHVVFFDAATRTPVACLRSTPGAGGARQAHAAVPTRDDAAVIVANQNGKLLERINTNYAMNAFVHDAAEDRDAHGPVATKGEHYVWVLDRAGNLAEVFDGRSGAHVNTVDLVSHDSADPTPDLAVIAPSGNRIFVSLRGPLPLSGDPHASTGITPGLAVVQVQHGGLTGFAKAIAPISNVDAGGVERADAHGIALRRIQ